MVEVGIERGRCFAGIPRLFERRKREAFEALGFWGYGGVAVPWHNVCCDGPEALVGTRKKGASHLSRCRADPAIFMQATLGALQPHIPRDHQPHGTAQPSATPATAGGQCGPPARGI